MKRNTIETLLNDKLAEGVELKPIIDAILNEAGKDQEQLKATITELTEEKDALSEKLETATNTINELKEVNADELKNKISELEDTLKAKDDEYAEKLTSIKFDASLDKAITNAAGKNAKAIKALLDVEALKASQNQNDDIAAAIEALKESDAYLFTSDEPIDNPTGKTGGGSTSADDAANKALRAAMGLSN